MARTWLTTLLLLAMLAAAGGVWSAIPGQVQLAGSVVVAPAHKGETPRERHWLSEQEKRQLSASGEWPASTTSLLLINHRLRYGKFIWNDRGVPLGDISVRVDLRTQLISVFRAGHEIGTAVILFGADTHQTPLGSYPILAMMRDHNSRTYNAPMPYTLRLTHDGVAIHGSEVRWGAATHGCIGVPLAFARRLFDESKPGNIALIVRSAPPDPQASAT